LNIRILLPTSKSPYSLHQKYGECGFSRIWHTPTTKHSNRLPHERQLLVTNGEYGMLDRPTLTKARAIKEPALDITGQGKRSLQQFQLKVDGQIKDSFAPSKLPKRPG
jgi:hypothetical protein